MHVTLLPYFYGKVMAATAVSFLLQSKTGQALQLPADPVFGLHNLLSPHSTVQKPAAKYCNYCNSSGLYNVLQFH